MQLSAIPVPVLFTPVQPIAAVAAIKGRDAETQEAGQKPRAAPPPRVGSLLDIEA